MLQCEGLGVPSIEPRQHVLSRMAHPYTYFADRRLERFVVAEASLPKRLFNRVVEVVGLILSDAPRALCPDAHCAKRPSSTDPCAEQNRDRSDARDVLIANKFLR